MAEMDITRGTAQGIDSTGTLRVLLTDGSGRPIPAATVTGRIQYNLTLTVAATEYSQVLPADCKGFEFQCRTAFDVFFAFITGHVAGPVAPYSTLKSGNYFWSGPIADAAAGTLFFASAQAGVVVEIIVWT